MKVQRDFLLEGLKKCLPGIEQGSSLIEGADDFIFTKNWVHSYNGNVSVSVPFEMDIEGAVRAQEFYNIISKLPSGELTIIQKKEEKIWLIKTGKIRIELVLMEQELDNYVKELALGNVKWFDLPENFEEAMKCCRMNTQSDAYGGIFIKNNIVCSTDGRRINRFQLEKEMETFWIRDNSAGELLKLGDLEQYGVSSAWVHFKSGETFFSCMRLADGNFPFEKMEKVLEKHIQVDSDISNTLPDGVDMAIDRASAMSMEVSGYKAVRMILGTDSVEIFSQRFAGSYSEKIPWEKPFKKGIAPVSVLIDCDSARYALIRSKKFYVKQVEKNTVRLVFFDDLFTHLIATLKQPEE